jgi:hypothetical protein
MGHKLQAILILGDRAQFSYPAYLHLDVNGDTCIEFEAKHAVQFDRVVIYALLDNGSHKTVASHPYCGVCNMCNGDTFTLNFGRSYVG